MALIQVPDALAQVLAGQDPSQPQTPVAPPPIIDAKYGRKPISGPSLMVPQAIPTDTAPAGNPNSPAYAQPVKDADTNTPDVAPPTIQTSAPSVPSPVADAVGGVPVRSNLSALIPPSMNTPQREQATKTLSTAAPTYDQYKPSILRTILGATAAFGLGWGHNPNAVEVGQNVIRAPFNNAMSTWQTNQNQAKEVLGEQDKQYENLTRLYGNAVNQDYRNETLNERERHNTQEETLRGQLNDAAQQRADAITQRDAAYAAKNDPKTVTKQRTADADAAGLKGADRARYILTGKYPEGLTDYQKQELDIRRKELTDKENKPGSPKNQKAEAWRFTRLDREKTRDLNKAEADARAGALSPEELEAEKQRIQDDYEKQIETMGGSVNHFEYGKGSQSTAPPAPQSGTRTPSQLGIKNLPRVGDTAPKSYTHTATNPKTGQKIGSSDGQTWYDVKTGKQI